MNRAALGVAFGIQAEREPVSRIVHEAVLELLREASPLPTPLRCLTRVRLRSDWVQTVIDIGGQDFIFEIYKECLEITNEQDCNRQICLPLADPDLIAKAWQFLLSV